MDVARFIIEVYFNTRSPQPRHARAHGSRTQADDEDGCCCCGGGGADGGGGGRAALRGGGDGVRGGEGGRHDGARLRGDGRRRRGGDAGGGRRVQPPEADAPPRRGAPPGAHHDGLDLPDELDVARLQRGQHQPPERPLQRRQGVRRPGQDQDLRLPRRLPLRRPGPRLRHRRQLLRRRMHRLRRQLRLRRRRRHCSDHSSKFGGYIGGIDEVCVYG